MSRIAKVILISIAAIVIIIQFIPVERNNPPIQEEIDAPQEVKNILERACYDCHSNKTEWPFYSYIAPVSWIVAGDVHEAREHINFTEWNNYSAKDREEIKAEIFEEVEEGEMPLKGYTILHPESKVSEVEIEILSKWAPEGEGGEEGYEHEH